MDCRELIEFLSEYLNGGLEPNERARFDVHLAECHDCEAYLDALRKTVRLVRTLRNDDLAASVTTMPISLQRAILTAHRAG